jgi:3D-(3,5/4)-trihydroxycyclohexane-1,2-dione acylhydrolase (decyclizing)
MNIIETMDKNRRNRAKAIKQAGSLRQAVKSGKLPQFSNITLSEAVILGLLNQGVRKYIGVFGHGSTDIGNALRIYEDVDLIKVYNVRNEVEASHIASAMRWQYNETCAVFTSIGPGAMHAIAGSLTALSNGLGVYYIFGDETTHNEGPNMQQIPRMEQELFMKLTTAMGQSYCLHTPEAVFTAMKWGNITVNNPKQSNPFYLLLPMNIQGKTIKNCNLLEFPEKTEPPKQITYDESRFEEAINLINKYEKITIKIGGGTRDLSKKPLEELIKLSGSVFVHGPNVSGVIPYNNPVNMTVGGSKGSICGNYAMEKCELLIAIGGRAVCQWDSSGTAWKQTKHIININTREEDALHYNRTTPLLGDAEEVIRKLVKGLIDKGIDKSSNGDSAWINECKDKKKEWEAFKQERYDKQTIYDEKWGREILTQPASIKIVCNFADKVKAVKYFDAGDVQANGFQIVQDNEPKQTFTDTGASYMGFAVSGVISSGIADKPVYSIAFTGDGSFMMNSQVIIDAVEHKVKAMICLFDNRRMSAISALQKDQYGIDYKTDDNVEVDYVKMAESVKGVKACFGGYSGSELEKALSEAYAYDGLSLVHIPVYYGNDELGGLGAFGSWNVGSWCDDVQAEKHRIGL